MKSVYLIPWDNTTPLFMVFKNGHYGVVQTLLGAGADVNIATSDVSDVMFYWYMNVLRKLLYM